MTKGQWQRLASSIALVTVIAVASSVPLWPEVAQRYGYNAVIAIFLLALVGAGVQSMFEYIKGDD